MAIMMDNKPEQYYGEAVVWENIKNNLPDDIICYYNRMVNNKEFDFCLLIKDLGIFVIEVKGWKKEHIKQVISPDEIHLADGTIVSSPKKQARSYRFALINIINSKLNVNPDIMDIVCYPFLTQKDYEDLNLNLISEQDFTLFKEDIESKNNFSLKLFNTYNASNYNSFDRMRNEIYTKCRHLFEPEFNENPPKTTLQPYSVLTVFDDTVTMSTFDKIQTIIDSYFNGTKHIIFTSNSEILNIITQKLFDLLNKNRIIPEGKNLKIAETKDEVNPTFFNNNFSIFNFEIYLVDNIKINSTFEVYNGKFTKEQIEFLKSLSQFTNFNIEQYMLEHAEINRDIQVKAGAGTGKTYSMVSRIAFLCNPSTNAQIYDIANDIAMLTFTDDAAANMKNRLKKIFTNYFILTKNTDYLDIVGEIENMRISTIHGFAKDIIKSSSLSLGIGADFKTVIGTYEKSTYLDRLFNNYLEEKNKENPSFFESLPFDIYDLKKFLMKIPELLYNKGCDIKNTSIEAFGKPINEIPYINEIIEKVVIPAEKEFSEISFENNSVRLSEYMIYLNKCISDELFNKNLFKFKYLFIDEFQDTDDAQISAFVKLKSKLNFKFFIVGDLKQSIYRFRGATMDAFQKMGCNDTSWLKFTLNTNYRSDKRLLSDYEIIFKYLGEKKLLPYNENEDKLIGIKHNNYYANGNQLIKIEYEKNDVFYDILFEQISNEKRNIEAQIKEDKLSLNERTIAILTRKNYQIDNILKKSKTKYENGEIDFTIDSDSSTDLYSLESTTDLCKLTSALTHPFDISYLYDLIQSNNVNIWLELSILVGKTEKEKREILIKCLDNFYSQRMGKTWLELIHYAQNEPILKVLHNIYQATKPWISYSKNEDKQEYYRINYELVFEEISSENRWSYPTLESIDKLLHIAITTGYERKSREIIKDNNDVRIICTTVHKSKGLEYGTVILPYTEGNIDTIAKNSVDSTFIDDKIGYCFTDKNDYNLHYANEFYSVHDEIDEKKKEETRILYVAMTRAINKFIWFANNNSNRNINWHKLLNKE